MTTRFVIADAQHFYREGFCSAIKKTTEYSIAGDVSNIQELQSLVNRIKIDVLIVDYHQEFFPLDDLASIKYHYPSIKIVFLSSQEKRWELIKNSTFEINGCLIKEATTDEILQGIHQIISEKNFFCPFVENLLKTKNVNLQPKKNIELTVREQQIADFIIKGLTNKEIGEKLFLSHHTIHTHRKRLMKKLNVSSALELILRLEQ